MDITLIGPKPSEISDDVTADGISNYGTFGTQFMILETILCRNFVPKMLKNVFGGNFDPELLSKVCE